MERLVVALGCSVASFSVAVTERRRSNHRDADDDGPKWNKCRSCS